MNDTSRYIQTMDNVLNLVFGIHIKRKCVELFQDAHHEKQDNITEMISIYIDDAIKQVKYEDVLLQWKQELKCMNIPETIQQMHALKISCIDWCETELKTDKWKKKMCKIVRSLLLVERWLLRTDYM